MLILVFQYPCGCVVQVGLPIAPKCARPTGYARALRYGRTRLWYEYWCMRWHGVLVRDQAKAYGLRPFRCGGAQGFRAAE